MTVTDQRSEHISHSRLNTIFIICQEDSVIPGRLQVISNGKFILTVQKGYRVADRFAAGFRIDGVFISIEMMKKTCTFEDNEFMIVEAMIADIAETDETNLKLLFKDLKIAE